MCVGIQICDALHRLGQMRNEMQQYAIFRSVVDFALFGINCTSQWLHHVLHSCSYLAGFKGAKTHQLHHLNFLFRFTLHVFLCQISTKTLVTKR